MGGSAVQYLWPAVATVERRSPIVASYGQIPPLSSILTSRRATKIGSVQTFLLYIVYLGLDLNARCIKVVKSVSLPIFISNVKIRES